MRTTKVTIDGAEVAIPNREIPELIATLTAIHQSLLISGAISAKPAEGFLSYEEAEQVLAQHYSDKMLRYHAGRVWGAMFRMTMYNELHFDAWCTICEKSVTAYSTTFKSRNCTHGAGSAFGYRRVLFSKSSILINYEEVLNSTMRTIGPSVKADFVRIADSIR